MGGHLTVKTSKIENLYIYNVYTLKQERPTFWTFEEHKLFIYASCFNGVVIKGSLYVYIMSYCAYSGLTTNKITCLCYS